MAPETRIIDLTLADLRAIVREQVEEAIRADRATRQDTPRFVYGLKGLMDLFHCSKSTAARIKASGKIDRAIRQIGDKMVIDSELALSLLK